jgi:hypothetical protein
MKMANKKNQLSESKDRDSRKATSFLEELTWLLSSYSNLDFKSLPGVLTGASQANALAKTALNSYTSNNPNKHFLVGALPRVLIDESIFPTNEDIAQFALTVMDVRVSRYEKKSKYEIIGHLVCETDRLDDRKLAKLVSALARLTNGGDKTRTMVKNLKAQNFGWNEIIQQLASNSLNG